LLKLTTARVLAQYRGFWLVAAPDREPELVTARGKLPLTPVTGDNVCLDEAGSIAEVMPRHGVIVRRAPGEAADGQVLAVNVDLALVTEPLPDPNERRLERFAALAGSGDVPVALVLTKSDLDPDGYMKAAQLGRTLGVIDSVAVSVRTGEGIDVVRGLLDPGATTVLLGASGTGKSTLINTLLGEERQKTGEIRADGRGRHTTVTRELLTLPGGAFLIDTPGIRIAGLWDGAGDTFADVEELALGCRFSDCGHTTEPGCAVRAALPPERIEAWRKLQEELAAIDDRRAKSRR
jgi:ribosome biogenesis GTPase / thiamine phosphate phosphatase